MLARYHDVANTTTAIRIRTAGVSQGRSRVRIPMPPPIITMGMAAATTDATVRRGTGPTGGAAPGAIVPTWSIRGA